MGLSVLRFACDECAESARLLHELRWSGLQIGTGDRVRAGAVEAVEAVDDVAAVAVVDADAATMAAAVAMVVEAGARAVR